MLAGEAAILFAFGFTKISLLFEKTKIAL